MNVLADRIFNLILGWTRSLFNSMWNLVTDDQQGFLGFLQRFWLPVILILLVVGTLTDYIIWMIRWRPYFVWRSWFRQRVSKRRRRVTEHYMDDLDHSPLDLPEYQQDQANFYPADEPVFFDFQQQDGFLYQQPQAQTRQPSRQEAAYVPPLPWEQPQMSVPLSKEEQAPPQGFVPVTPLEYRETCQPPVFFSEEATASQDSGPASAPSVVRHRRSQRRGIGNVFQQIRQTIERQNSGPVDSLPPPVSREEVFYEPYIPENYVYRHQQPVQHHQEPADPRQTDAPSDE